MNSPLESGGPPVFCLFGDPELRSRNPPHGGPGNSRGSFITPSTLAEGVALNRGHPPTFFRNLSYREPLLEPVSSESEKSRQNFENPRLSEIRRLTQMNADSRKRDPRTSSALRSGTRLLECERFIFTPTESAQICVNLRSTLPRSALGPAAGRVVIVENATAPAQSLLAPRSPACGRRCNWVLAYAIGTWKRGGKVRILGSIRAAIDTSSI
jgi:hypothetical protein